MIKIGSKYKHSKSGKIYTVICLAKHSETLEDLVIYRAEYEDKEFGKNAIWARPVRMFEEKVVINGIERLRFELSEEE